MISKIKIEFLQFINLDQIHPMIEKKIAMLEPYEKVF